MDASELMSLSEVLKGLTSRHCCCTECQGCDGGKVVFCLLVLELGEVLLRSVLVELNTTPDEHTSGATYLIHV